MLKRLVVGLLIGLIVGALAAVVLAKGLGQPVFGGVVFAYLAASLTGVATGLVAGKPIWSADGKVEAGLKAIFGALLAAGAMFALKRWAPDTAIDLSSLGLGAGPIADLPAASLPAIGALLGGLFELDNTGDPAEPRAALPTSATRDGAPSRVGAPAGRPARVAPPSDEELDDEPAPAAKKKR